MIQTLIPFIKLTQNYALVDRDCKFYDLSRKENDSEHAFQIAISVWYLADSFNLDLSRERLLKYALAHDLVEVYAGDTAPFTDDPEVNLAMMLSKDEREANALKKLGAEFTDFTGLFATIAEYEKKNDPESRFVYIVDKLIADINCFLSGESYYQDRNYSYGQWQEWYDHKFLKLGNLSEIETKLLGEYRAFMQENRVFFFGA